MNNNAPTMSWSKDVLRWEWYLLYMWYTISTSRVFYFLVGYSTILYPCSCRWKMSYVWPEISGADSHQIPVLKDTNTPNMTDLTIMWRILAWFVVKTGFVELMLQNITQGGSCLIVLLCTGTFTRWLYGWRMCTTGTGYQTACTQTLCIFLWMCWGFC